MREIMLRGFFSSGAQDRCRTLLRQPYLLRPGDLEPVTECCVILTSPIVSYSGTWHLSRRLEGLGTLALFV